jgi:virulence factor Mce-like protein
MNRRLAGGLAVVLVVVVATVVVGSRSDEAERSLVAHFVRTVGVHTGSDVRIMGVEVGTVVDVRPQGRTVRVEMRYAARYDLPADVRAVIVPPSIVSDRYVQLTPAFTGGPTLPEGFVLPVERTAVPLEVDDVYRALDDLNRALGPDGANSDGALADLVATARANLEGNGDKLHDTVAGLDRALSTLADGRADLFGTVSNLADFSAALAASDQQVREFNRRLADVGEQLAAERDELAAALRTLSIALSDVTAFVRDNREALKSNVAALADVTGVLVRQQRAIMDILDVAPLALSNLNLAYNARSGTLDTRDNVLGPHDPAAYVCSLLVNAVPLADVPRACLDLARMLADAGLPLTDELRRLLGLAPGGTPVAPARPGGPTEPDLVAGVTDQIDRTLGGILRGRP